MSDIQTYESSRNKMKTILALKRQKREKLIKWIDKAPVSHTDFDKEVIELRQLDNEIGIRETQLHQNQVDFYTNSSIYSI